MLQNRGQDRDRISIEVSKTDGDMRNKEEYQKRVFDAMDEEYHRKYTPWPN